MIFYNYPSLSAIEKEFNPQSSSFSKVSIDNTLTFLEATFDKRTFPSLLRCTKIISIFRKEYRGSKTASNW